MLFAIVSSLFALSFFLAYDLNSDFQTVTIIILWFSHFPRFSFRKEKGKP